MPADAYRLSFTTGGLLRVEGARVAEVMLTASDLTAARTTAVRENLVQQRTHSSTVRVTREVVQRLVVLPPAGLELMTHGSVDDTRHLMWLAACLRYRFLRDFGSEVLRDRYTSGIGQVGHEDFDAFWNVQSSWVDALRDAADSTRAKLRQNTFRMLHEAEMVDDRSQIRPVLLSPAVADVVRAADPTLLMSFPIDDGQVAALLAAGSGVG